MAINFQSLLTAVTGSGGGTTLTVTWPTVTAGEYALLALGLGSTSSTITDPSGWTTMGSLDESTTLRTKSWYRKLDGTETGSLSVSWSGTTTGSLIFARYSGIDATTGISGTGVNYVNGTASASGTFSPTAPLVNTTKTTMPVYVFFSSQSSVTSPTISATASYALRANVVSNSATTPYIQGSFADQAIIPPGASGPNSNWFGQTAIYAFHKFSWIQDSTSTSTLDSTMVSTTVSVTAPAPASQVLSNVVLAPSSGQMWPRGGRTSTG